MAATTGAGRTTGHEASERVSAAVAATDARTGRDWTSASTVLLVSVVAAAVIVLCSLASVALRTVAVFAGGARRAPRARAIA
jgi:hypothetical protein